VAHAREAFLTSGPIPSGTVRQPILASWTRSQQLSVPANHLDLGEEADSYRDSPLLSVAAPLIDDVADQMATEPMSVILCDDEGVVLLRRTGDSSLKQHLDRVWLAPGFSYTERNVGTNGIGTTLESRGPAHVFGPEHYVEHLEALACAGAPIRHPVTGRLIGVLDLTCWRGDANAMMITTASMIAKRIEDALLARARRHELTLMHDYLTACHRSRGVVLAVGEDLLMMNDRAREQLAPGDQAPLVAAATDALSSGHKPQLIVDLPSGVTAKVQCRPSGHHSGGVGAVLLVQLINKDDATGSHGRRTRSAPPLPTAVGSGALWTMCREAVDRHFGAREWLVLNGEPGSGKRTLARATHQRRTPAAHLRVLDAADYGPSWIDDVVDELSNGGGTLILAHVDRLPSQAAQALTDVLDPHRESTDPDRPWVVATCGSVTADDELARVIGCFPRTIDVPPLRHHIEDVAELVRHFLARMTHGGDLTCSPEAMRVLMRNRWPGNVEQLQQVLRKTVARRRTGVIDVRDLPAEIYATIPRVLTPLEAIECDAIVNALLETRGNKAEAAQLLGMSRATIYRKIREYGIAMPTSTQP
jgi:transcriptional regulator of acetoin/glycerol metabolism